MKTRYLRVPARLTIVLLGSLTLAPAATAADIAEVLRNAPGLDPAPTERYPTIAVGIEMIEALYPARRKLNVDPFAGSGDPGADSKLSVLERQLAIVGTYSPAYIERKSNGSERGGGGDGDESRVRTKADAIFERLKSSAYFRKAFAQAGLAPEAFQAAFSRDNCRIVVVDTPISIGFQNKAMISLRRGTVVETARGSLALPYNLVLVNAARYLDLKRSPVDEERNIAHEGLVLLELEQTNDDKLSRNLFSGSVFIPSEFELGASGADRQRCSAREVIDQTQDKLQDGTCAAMEIMKGAELRLTQRVGRDGRLTARADGRAYLAQSTRAHEHLLLAALDAANELQRLLDRPTDLAALLHSAFPTEVTPARRVRYENSLSGLPPHFLDVFKFEFTPMWKKSAPADYREQADALIGHYLSFYFHTRMRARLDPHVHLVNKSTEAAIDHAVAQADPMARVLLLESMAYDLNTQFVLGLVDKRIHFPYESTETYMLQLRRYQPEYAERFNEALDFYSRQRRELKAQIEQLEPAFAGLNAVEAVAARARLERLKRALEPAAVLYDR